MDMGLSVEMADYKQFFTLSDVFKVYFADPHSAWGQGGSENFSRIVQAHRLRAFLRQPRNPVQIQHRDIYSGAHV